MRIGNTEHSHASLKEISEFCYNLAVEKGWGLKGISIPEQIALIHSEASEALESWRDNDRLSWTDDSGKPQGLASEYADVIIRVCHYAHILGIDLDIEIERKLRYNRLRPYRHGGKKI